MFSKYDNKDIEKMLAEVEALQQTLTNTRPLNEDELRVVYDDFSVEFTYDSNAIEGNTITLDETFMLIKQGITAINKTAQEQMEIINHHNLFMQLINEVKSKKLMSEKLILDIHKSLLYSSHPEIAGKYRKIDVGVGRMEDFYHAPQFDKVPDMMKQFVSEFNANKQKGILDFVDAHIDFESIHPFADGNGRVGRMLLNFQLIKAGYLPINIKFADRRDYYNAFKNIRKIKDSTFMYGIVLALQIESIKNRLDILRNNLH
ncbi:MAG: Fic family protein [Bacillota bacterium]